MAFEDDAPKRSRRLETSEQTELFGPRHVEPGCETRSPGTSGFVAPDPHALTLGSVRLSDHLAGQGLAWVMAVRQLLWTLDYDGFTAQYSLQGRPPYHPAIYLGLVLYGVMTGRSSLRELEQMAAADLGAMWMTGGIFPDHSSIGKFLHRHADVISDGFFEDLIRQILDLTDRNPQVWGVDGTVIESAGSRFKVIKKESAEQAAKEARARADEHPEDETLQQLAEKAEAVAEAADEHDLRRRQNGSTATETRVSKTDPQSTYQRLKQKRGYAPGYVSSIVANAHGMILAQAIHPSSELPVVDALLEQSRKVTGHQNAVCLADSHYHCQQSLAAAKARGMVMLAPSASQVSGREPRKFTRESFKRDDEHDTYECPAGKILRRRGTHYDSRRGVRATTYGPPHGNPCATCELAERCTSSAAGRSLKVQEGAELRDAARQRMEQTEAQSLYRYRGTLAEPVFSELRGLQRLSRFRRFGLAGVSLEFALHACAHNLRRFALAWQAYFGDQAAFRHRLPASFGIAQALLTSIFLYVTSSYRTWIQTHQFWQPKQPVPVPARWMT